MVCISPSIGVSVIYACVGNYSAVDTVSTCKYCSVNSYGVVQGVDHVTAIHQVIPAPEWVFLVNSESVNIIACDWVIMAAPNNPCRMNRANSSTIIKLTLPSVEYSTAYYMSKSIFTEMMLLTFLPAYDSYQDLLIHNLTLVRLILPYISRCVGINPTLVLNIYLSIQSYLILSNPMKNNCTDRELN